MHFLVGFYPLSYHMWSSLFFFSYYLNHLKPLTFFCDLFPFLPLFCFSTIIKQNSLLLVVLRHRNWYVTHYECKKKLLQKTHWCILQFWEPNTFPFPLLFESILEVTSKYQIIFFYFLLTVHVFLSILRFYYWYCCAGPFKSK